METLHNHIGRDNGHYAANRLLALVRGVFNWAIRNELHTTNPATGIRPFKEHSRDRFLHADELPKFFEALAMEPNTTIRDYILLSLLTGARKANVLSMRWEQVDLDNRLWRIPETKNGDAHSLPLAQEAITVLEQRKALATGSPFVFPGIGRTGHLAEPKSGWRRILERAGLAGTDLHIHDLRRTLGSWQAGTGASLSIIGKTLGHRNVSTTAIYARLDTDPVREAVERATSAMMGAAKSADDDNVVPLHPPVSTEGAKRGQA